MTQDDVSVLVIGYGNPGRLDDGLGPALAEKLQKDARRSVTVTSNYQLNVEDAADVAKHDVVVFVDATLTGEQPFEFRRIEPNDKMSYTTHSLEPQAVLGLANRLFAATTTGYVLAIRGYAFDNFSEQLSPKAHANLDAALDFLRTRLTNGQLRKTDGQVRYA